MAAFGGQKQSLPRGRSNGLDDGIGLAWLTNHFHGGDDRVLLTRGSGQWSLIGSAKGLGQWGGLGMGSISLWQSSSDGMGIGVAPVADLCF